MAAPCPEDGGGAAGTLARPLAMGNYTALQAIYGSGKSRVFRGVRTDALAALAGRAEPEHSSASPACSSAPPPPPPDRHAHTSQQGRAFLAATVPRARGCAGWALETFIIKTVQKDRPTVQDLAPLRHEYKVLKDLNVEGVIKAVALESFGNGLALVLSDFEGQTLDKELAQRTLPVEEVLQIAVDLVRVLGRLHAQGIIHRDVKPSNIMYNAHTKQVQLIDFGVSSRLASESAHCNAIDLVRCQVPLAPRDSLSSTWTSSTVSSTPALSASGGTDEAWKNASEVMVGTLAYMSPEQTGRMNRVVDYRSDLYSLGITLFELLTCRLPFRATHRLEYVHCHMAMLPPRADQIAPHVSRAVGDVVAKLLAKNAEDRYQSAEGLLADLQLCKDAELQRVSGIEMGHKAPSEPASMSGFVAGRMDQYSRFVLPQKLYGRVAEVGQLLSAFDRVAASGKCEAILVKGMSGIGKTSIVFEVQKPIVRNGGGCFITGKFDQFHRGSASLVSAFRDLLRHLLSEGRDAVELWRVRIMEAVGTNGQLIVDVLPELGKIIGKQPVPTEVGPAEAENRFNRVFMRFVRLFCRQEHPLVLFLDDLQWADATSLQLLTLLMCDQSLSHVLLIGAYRDSEVSDGHPLLSTVAQFSKHRLPIVYIDVQPLHVIHVTQLISEITHASEVEELEACTQLARILIKTTAGNPFYVSQLLRSLHQDGHIAFSFSKGRWEWDINKLQEQVDSTDNVVDLMVRQIQKLNNQAQQVLRFCAAIGDKFSLQEVATVLEQDPCTTARALWQALHAGLVLPMSQIFNIFVDMPEGEDGEVITRMQEVAGTCIYRFLHDRVQQAAYSLIPREERELVHLTIGRRLLATTQEDKLDANLYPIVNQLNAGLALIDVPEEREEVAMLNFIAGKKAKATTAYKAAVHYLDLAVGLIVAQQDNDLLRSLNPETETAEASSLPQAGNSWSDSRRAIMMSILREAAQAHFLNANYDRAEAMCALMLQYAQETMDRVLVAELRLMFRTNRHLLAEALEMGQLALELLGVRLVSDRPELRITERNVDSWPRMTDDRMLAAMRVLTGLFAAAFVRDPALNAKLAYTLVDLTQRHGLCALSAFGFAYYATNCVLEDPTKARLASSLGLALLTHLNAPELTPKVHAMIYGTVAHWFSPLRSLVDPLLFGKKVGLEVGDHEWAAHCENNVAEILTFSGESLDVVYPTIERHYNDLVARGHTMQGVFINTWRRFTLKMNQLDYPETYEFFGRMVTDRMLLDEQREAKQLLFWFTMSLAMGMFHYFEQDYVQSAELLRTATIIVCGRLVNCAQVRFWASLPLLQLAKRHPKGSRELQDILHNVNENQKALRWCARVGPMNYKYKYQLVKAEVWSLLGKHAKAMDLYEKAIRGAVRNMFTMDEGIAKELAGEFYCCRNKHNFGAGYIRDAYYAYLRWGATRKVRYLELRLKELADAAETPIIATLVPATKNEDQQRLRSPVDVFSKSTGDGDKTSILTTVVNISRTLFGEHEEQKLLDKLMSSAMDATGADRCVLLSERDGVLYVQASAQFRPRQGDVSVEGIVLKPGAALDECSAALPRALIEFVWKERETVVLGEMDTGQNSAGDEYLAASAPNEVICTPVVHLNKLLGVLYLENKSRVAAALRSDSVWLISLVAAQMGISLNNSYLFQQLHAKSQQLEVSSRTLW
jgi:predicted ATPase/serine/threonine protein kinase